MEKMQVKEENILGTIVFLGLLLVVGLAMQGCTVSVSADWFGQSTHDNKTSSPVKHIRMND